MYASKRTIDGKDFIRQESVTANVPKSPQTMVHDQDGNLVNDERFQYAWNAENRLIEVVEDGKQKLEFVYDHMGRRTIKKVYSWVNDAWQLDKTITFVYDHYNEIARFEDGTLAKKFVWGEDLSGSLQGAGGVGGLLLVADSTNTYAPVYDANGNITAYIDANTGNQMAEYSYSPFGRTVTKSGSKADEFDYKFSTKPQDEETGLYYYIFRFYGPEMGRWLSRDPAEEFGGENLYVFCFNKNDIFDILGGVPATKQIEEAVKLANQYWEFAKKNPLFKAMATKAAAFAARLIGQKYQADENTKYMGEFFLYWLSDNKGKPKYLVPASKYFADKKILPHLIRRADYEIKKASGASVGETITVTNKNTDIQDYPDNVDMRSTIGRVTLHYSIKMRFFRVSKTKKKLCKAYSTWWINDKYSFHKKNVGIGNTMLNEDLLRALVTAKEAHTFFVRAVYYGKHEASFGEYKASHSFRDNPWKLSLKPIFPEPETDQDQEDQDQKKQ